MIVVVVLIAGVLIPVIGASKSKSQRIACIGNLKQIGLAKRQAEINRDRSSSVIKTDRHELDVDIVQLWQLLLGQTNGWGTPQLLWCPADTQRHPAAAFRSNAVDSKAVVFATGANLSYFLGPRPVDLNPQAILAGDRNLTTNGVALGPGRHSIPLGTIVGFSEQLHRFTGNVLLGDGSVQQGSNGRIKEMFQEVPHPGRPMTNFWLIP